MMKTVGVLVLPELQEGHRIRRQQPCAREEHQGRDERPDRRHDEQKEKACQGFRRSGPFRETFHLSCSLCRGNAALRGLTGYFRVEEHLLDGETVRAAVAVHPHVRVRQMLSGFLASFAYDAEIKLAARMVLDYISAHMAVSSSDGRRLV